MVLGVLRIDIYIKYQKHVLYIFFPLPKDTNSIKWLHTVEVIARCHIRFLCDSDMMSVCAI